MKLPTVSSLRSCEFQRRFALQLRQPEQLMLRGGMSGRGRNEDGDDE